MQERLGKCLTKGKMGERGRKKVKWMIVGMIEGEVSERGWKVIERVSKTNMGTPREADRNVTMGDAEGEVNEVGGKVIAWVIKKSTKTKRD